MLILLPFFLIVLIIVAINNIYYSDAKPIDIKNSKQIEKRVNKRDNAQNYIDKYITTPPTKQTNF